MCLHDGVVVNSREGVNRTVVEHKLLFVEKSHTRGLLPP